MFIRLVGQKTQFKCQEFAKFQKRPKVPQIEASHFEQRSCFDLGQYKKRFRTTSLELGQRVPGERIFSFTFSRATRYMSGVYNISLDLLKTFVTFASSESMTETAQKLGISQPAVTFQLKKLEDELPVAPFTTSGNRKVLNNFGRALFNSLVDRFHEIEVSLNKVNNMYANPENYTFRIGGRKEVLSRILPRLEILGTIEAIGMTEDEIMSGLLQQKIDIAITFQPIEHNDVFQRSLFTDQGKLCVHRKFLKGQKLSEEKLKDSEFLLQTPVIAYNRRFPYLYEWLTHCGLKVNDLTVRCLYEDWNAIMKLVENGVGYTIIPSEFRSNSPDVVSFEIPASVIPPKSFYAFYHKDLKEMGVINKLFKDF